MSVTEMFSNKKVLIWGYGREGMSTERFLKRCCNPASIEIYEGKRDGIIEKKYDYIIKSPGIVMEEDNPKYTSQTQIFLQEYRDRVIGITGTKGKSTTSTMMYNVLKALSGKTVILLGNIGEPCLDYFDLITEDTIVVFEMSCHQLAHITVSPHIAIFLNLFEEHLDYYGTVKKYFDAKSHIALFQKNDDYFFAGSNVSMIKTKAKKTVIDASKEYDYELSLNGEHNKYNAEFVYEVATGLFGINGEDVKKALKTCKGLPHRLEYIGELNKVKFYDDSISTIPEATISAIKSLKDVKTVIVGGMDRMINYDILVKFAKENKDINFIFTYDSGLRMYGALKGCENCVYIKELEAAVEKAKEITKDGSCLLSPASASYGYFKNFEQRGEMFKLYVGV